MLENKLFTAKKNNIKTLNKLETVKNLLFKYDQSKLSPVHNDMGMMKKE